MNEDNPHPTESPALAAGGWCAPAETIYDIISPVTARRGGLQFQTQPLSKKELSRKVDRLTDALTAERKINRKLRRKNKRLLKAIERII